MCKLCVNNMIAIGNIMVKSKLTKVLEKSFKDMELNKMFKLDVGYARYSDLLEEVLIELNAVEVLRKDYEDDYQGHVDVDVLLFDGRVFSYLYYYGSCSGCDEWESEGYDDNKIKEIILKEATFFSDVDSYSIWLSRRCIDE